MQNDVDEDRNKTWKAQADYSTSQFPLTPQARRPVQAAHL